ncbi:MAG TPA: AraC family transcriptional regulator [Thermoanaerobaculia bacterium]|nr:AraC family transcriptional regulator [Thermoanaerobaculia bacterium]
MRARFVPLPARREHEVAAAASPSFRVTETRYPGGLVVSRHAHANPSLTFTRRGALCESVAGRSFDNDSPAALLVRPPEERHADRVQEGGAVNLEIEILPGASPLLSDWTARLAGVRQLRHPRLAALAGAIGAELRCRDTAQPLVVEGLALEIVGIASRLRSRRAAAGSPPWLSRVRERLESSFRERLLLTEVAREAGVHPVSLARAFRARHGESPGEYVRRLRIEWALRELRASSPRPIGEIALDAGFFDQSHFHRVFRRLTGTSPGAIRASQGRRSA